ncbi:hypothetical protein ACFXKD_05050 [Nocardiopsis aegyptia]|uniref:hypothetical protein n=1 Tax=Nocardiopsis aegyptia TaxID=220378 RepID=UPI003671D521
MRILRTILLWLGLLSLLVSVVLALAMVESNQISGGLSWQCQVQSAEFQECTVMTGSSTLAELDLAGVSLPMVSALVGIGFLLGAIALGQTTAAPAAQAPVPAQPVAAGQHAPYPGPQQQRAPQPPPGHHPQHRG